jgi:uncharacterized membrane protein
MDAIETLLHDVAHFSAVLIEAIAIAVIVAGALEAVVDILKLIVARRATNEDRRDVWLKFARWLVAGLTFQLAADIVNTSFNSTWDELGRLAAIAAIRTFLSFFLDREVDETRRRQHPAIGTEAPSRQPKGESP